MSKIYIYQYEPTMYILLYLMFVISKKDIIKKFMAIMFCLQRSNAMCIINIIMIYFNRTI